MSKLMRSRENLPMLMMVRVHPNDRKVPFPIPVQESGQLIISTLLLNRHTKGLCDLRHRYRYRGRKGPSTVPWCQKVAGPCRAAQSGDAGTSFGLSERYQGPSTFPWYRRVGGPIQSIQSLVPESGWPHPIPNLPLLSWSADLVGGLCLRLKLVSEDLEHTQVISHDNHALGTAHAFARVTAKTGLPIMHQLGASPQRPRWLR